MGDIGDEEIVNGPPYSDRYNGPHRLKLGISDYFCNVLQCVMQTTTMTVGFF